jgi:hypothetical protein
VENFLKKGLDLVKAHPVTTGAVVVVGGLAIFVLNSGSSSGGAVASSAATTNPAQAQLAIQQDSEQFQLAQGNQTITGQQNLATIAASTTDQSNQLGFQLGVDQLASQTTQEQDATNASVAINQLNTTSAAAVSQAGIAAQVAINQNNNQTAVAQTAQIAQEQEFATATNAQLQTAISNNQTLVATNQIAATTQIAQIQGQVTEALGNDNKDIAENSSNNGLIGGIIKAIF